MPKNGFLNMMNRSITGGMVVCFVLGVLSLTVDAQETPSQKTQPLPQMRGPLAIQFVGVQPDGSDMIYGPNGGALPESGSRSWVVTSSRGNQGWIFHWRIPYTGRQTMMGRFGIKSSQDPEQDVIEPLQLQMYPYFRGDQQYLAIAVELAETDVPFRQVDLSLEYYHGPRRNTRYTMQGPFLIDKPVSTTLDPNCTIMALSADVGLRTPGAAFALESPVNPSFSTLWAYDQGGQRHPMKVGSGGGGATTGYRHVCWVDGLSHKDVTSITIDEPAFGVIQQQVTIPAFHALSGKPYLQQLAEGLGQTNMPWSQAMSYSFLNTNEVLRLLPMLRGSKHIGQAYHALFSFTEPSGLIPMSPEQERTVSEAALLWAKDTDILVRSWGILLGLKVGGGDFIDKALTLLETPLQKTDIPIKGYLDTLKSRRAQVVFALQNNETMSEENILRVKRIIARPRDAYTDAALLWVFRPLSSDVAKRAVRELMFDSRAWIWWPALETIYKRYPDLVTPFERQPGIVRQRLAFVLLNEPTAPPPDFVDVNSVLFTQARESAMHNLGAMLTPETITASAMHWSIFRQIVNHLEREQAAKSFRTFCLTLSKKSPQHWERTGYSYLQDAITLTCHMACTLNSWYGVNLGRLGTTPEQGDQYSLNRPQDQASLLNLLAEMNRWLETPPQPVIPPVVTPPSATIPPVITDPVKPKINDVITPPVTEEVRKDVVDTSPTINPVPDVNIPQQPTTDPLVDETKPPSQVVNTTKKQERPTNQEETVTKVVRPDPSVVPIPSEPNEEHPEQQVVPEVRKPSVPQVETQPPLVEVVPPVVVPQEPEVPHTVGPDPEAYFPNDMEAGTRLDRIFFERGRGLSTERLLMAVRQGFRHARASQVLLLDGVGKQFIEEQTRPEDRAVEILYHASAWHPRQAAQYLSQVPDKSPELLQLLATLSLQGHEVEAVIEGVTLQREAFLEYVRPSLQSPDPQERERAKLIVQQLGRKITQPKVVVKPTPPEKPKESLESVEPVGKITDPNVTKSVESKITPSPPHDDTLVVPPLVESVTVSHLQSLIDRAKPGDTIQVPAGTYTEPIRIQQGPITLQGQDRDQCILSVVADSPALWIETKERARITVTDLTIKWQLENPREGLSHPFAMFGCDSEILVQNCRFVSAGTPKQSPIALRVDGTADITLYDCRSQGFALAFCFGEGTQARMEDCMILNTAHQGVTAYAGSTLFADRCVVAGSKFHGIRCSGATFYLKNSLIVKNQRSGIYLGNKDGSGSLTGNIIVQNGAGITGYYRSSFRIQKNIFFGRHQIGIGTWDTCCLSIEKNIFHGNATAVVLYPQGQENNLVLGSNTYWRNIKDTENCEPGTGALFLDPGFNNPSQNDFSLVNGPVRDKDHGLPHPELIKELCRKYEEN